MKYAELNLNLKYAGMKTAHAKTVVDTEMKMNQDSPCDVTIATAAAAAATRIR